MTDVRPSPGTDSAAPLFFSPLGQPVPLCSVAALRQLEHAAAAELPPHTLMARAGHAAARFLLAQRTDTNAETNTNTNASTPAPRPVWIIAGPGNNGGDALVMASELQRAGVAVQVCLPQPVSTDTARWALATAQAAGVPVSAAVPATFDASHWIVDGMFGIGLTRPLDGVFAALAQRLRHHTRHHGKVLALDLPSGLHSDTGEEIEVGNAVQASHTLSFIAAKPGLFMASGRDHAGHVSIAPLGLDGITSTFVLNAPALFGASMPPRDFASHKGRFGSLAVIGGDTGLCGAPVLAARAALHAGAGKVHVVLLSREAPAYDPPYPELMLHPAGTLPLASMSALALGCGMGQRARARRLLRQALALDLPTLLDADALNLLAADAALAAYVSARNRQGQPCLLTPHPLEAARLLGVTTAAVQRDRLAAARALVERFACVVVLKGSGTLVAAPDGRCALNPTGGPALASGGTGDVLGGLIGALLAQQLPVYEAALAGVYLHGLAADTLSALGDGPAGLTAGELAPMVRKLINRFFYSHANGSAQ